MGGDVYVIVMLKRQACFSFKPNVRFLDIFYASSISLIFGIQGNITQYRDSRQGWPM
jgi:hypothetical protein